MGVCRNGNLEMLGLESEFAARIKQRSSNAVGTHCVIYCEALPQGLYLL